MEQHCRPDSDGIAVHRGDDRHLVPGERAEQAPDGNILAFPRLGHGLEEIAKVVTGGKILALALERD